jgi:chaperonin cofactor prefoldin
MNAAPIDTPQLEKNFPHPNFEKPLFGPQGQNLQPHKPRQPLAKVRLLSEKLLKSKPAEQARGLYAELQKAQVKVDRVKGEKQEADAAVKASRRAAENTHLIDKEVEAGGNRRAIVEKLDADVQAKEKYAHVSRWRGEDFSPGAPKSGWIGDAENEAVGAYEALERYVTGHADELAKELRTDAERVHKAISALLKQMEPLEKQHDEITQTLRELYGRTPGVTKEHIPTEEYDKRPVLAAEARAPKQAPPTPKYESIIGGTK